MPGSGVALLTDVGFPVLLIVSRSLISVPTKSDLTRGIGLLVSVGIESMPSTVNPGSSMASLLCPSAMANDADAAKNANDTMVL